MPKLQTGAGASAREGGVDKGRWAHRRQAAAYKELLQREERRAKLGGVLERMTLEKAVMVSIDADPCSGPVNGSISC